jgi:hypothetical protein
VVSSCCHWLFALKCETHFVEMDFNDIGCLMPNMFNSLSWNVLESVERKNCIVSIRAPTLSNTNGEN